MSVSLGKESYIKCILFVILTYALLDCSSDRQKSELYDAFANLVRKSTCFDRRRILMHKLENLLHQKLVRVGIAFCLFNEQMTEIHYYSSVEKIIYAYLLRASDVSRGTVTRCSKWEWPYSNCRPCWSAYIESDHRLFQCNFHCNSMFIDPNCKPG